MSITFTTAGFFPREVVVPTGWLADRAPGVLQVCSASRCIAEGPIGWMDHWIHNAWGLFSTPEQAHSIVPDVDAPHVELHGYRLGSIAWEEGEPIAAPVQPHGCSQLPTDAAFLGYDVVGQDRASFPACSPLSCNGGAQEFDVNCWCLLPTVEEAVHAAARFSGEDWEPGIYHIVEVWRIGATATPRP